MAGRPPKPTGAKILAGTFRKCRANPNEPEIEALTEIPDPPRRLKLVAHREWDRVIGYLVRNRIVGAEGLSIVATYCNLHACIVACEKKDEMPPATLVAQYRSLAESLGLTGSSRARIHKPQPKPAANPWEALK